MSTFGRNVISKKEIKKETDRNIDDFKSIFELGERFMRDKEKLEEKREEIRDSRIDSDDKLETINEIDDTLKRLQDDYFRIINEKISAIEKEVDKIYSNIDDGVEEFEKQGDTLDDFSSITKEVDVKDAIRENDKQKSELEKMRELFEREVDSMTDKINDQYTKMKTLR